MCQSGENVSKNTLKVFKNVAKLYPKIFKVTRNEFQSSKSCQNKAHKKAPQYTKGTKMQVAPKIIMSKVSKSLL